MSGPHQRQGANSSERDGADRTGPLDTNPSAPDLLDTAGPAAPPRKNGELTFTAPWESRVFGLALALHRRGLFAWDEFRARLIAAIAERERELAAGEDTLITPEHDHAAGEWSYYACWLTALERLLADKGLCPPAEVDARATALAARPAGHDHNH